MSFTEAMKMTPPEIDGWTYAVAIAAGRFDEIAWEWIQHDA